MKVILTALVSGVLLAYFGVLPGFFMHNTGNIVNCSLAFLLLMAGIQMGRNRQAFRAVAKAGVRVLLIPLGSVIGSLIGCAVAGMFLGFSLSEGAAIGSGFGWYSLAPAILTGMKGAEFATVSFLHNILREFLTLALIPMWVKLVGPIAAIGSGGATTMDVSLPIYIRYGGTKAGIIAFVNGAILSMLVPILVPLFASLH